MAEESNELHEIFTVDPDDLKRYVDRYVEICFVDGAKLSGIVYTVDPVSQSYILVTKEGKSVSVKIVMKHSIKSVSAVPEIPEELKTLDLNNIFKNNIDQKTGNEVKAMKEKVKLWLLKNMIPVEEKGDLLMLDTLEIHPPYNADSCFSSNSIVLDRIQNLLKDMKLES
ncbi:UNVERIFIED_CONTAM: hypothetical protein PYX00_009798 [Menopon gallinae]|uniref:AD domain-containing protein n=1 Tax=Menopon gallinae TaxID=328185 RepID=A0AAW2HD51_9NEOP